MELNFLAVKIESNGGTLDGHIEVGKIETINRAAQDPNKTVVYLAHRMLVLHENYDSFCKRLEEVCHE